MLYRIRKLLSEILLIAREGTLVGTLVFIKYKRNVEKAASAWQAGDQTRPGIGIIGAGTYLASIHLPCLRKHKEPLYAIMSRSGKTAKALAFYNKIGVVYEDIDKLISDEKCTALLIATPHNLHPEHIIKVLEAGHYAYCEKPVAIDQAGIELLKQYSSSEHRHKIMIGFNRRFAPAVLRLRQEQWLCERNNKIEIHYRVNFGKRVDNAMSDPSVGGGRIHGAACHYIDMIYYLSGVSIKMVSAYSVSVNGQHDDNTFTASMVLEDGSIAGVTFTSEGGRENDTKEEIIVSCGGHNARIINFRTLFLDGRKHNFYRHCYGTMTATDKFLSARDDAQPVPVSLEDGINATCVTLAIQESIQQQGAPVRVKY